MDRETLEWFLDEAVERLFGSSRDYLNECRAAWINSDDRDTFTFELSPYLIATGGMAVCRAAGLENMDAAIDQDDDGKPSEPTYIEFAGFRALRSGQLNLVINDAPVCFRPVSTFGNEFEFRFYYAKDDSADVMPTLVALRDEILSAKWFKGRRVVFAQGDLSLVAPAKASFNDIVMPDSILEGFKSNTSYYLENAKELEANGIPSRRGVLLSGPPGTGKSLMARAAASMAPVGTTEIWVTGSSVSKVNHIEDLFKLAKGLSPSIIIFEDIDTLGNSREQLGQTTSLLGEMLTQMDGISDTNGVIIIATTNYPQFVDAALRDRPKRFDRHFKVALPDQGGRVAMLSKLLHGDGVTDVELSQLAGMLDGASGAIIEEVVTTARVNAIRGKQALSSDLLYAAVREVKQYEPTMYNPGEFN